MTYIIYCLFIFILCIVSLPLQVGVAVSVLLFSGVPIFFTQKRIGLSGRPFIMYKFRTMRVDASKLQLKFKKQNEADGPAFKIYNDPRYTNIGKFLSHTGFDELPQLYNVLRGDMALFGPRPLPVGEAAKLTKKQQRRHTIKPGILSPWVLHGYHTRTFQEWMESDLSYIKNKSVWYDIRFFGKSFLFMIHLIWKEVSGLFD